MTISQKMSNFFWKIKYRGERESNCYPTIFKTDKISNNLFRQTQQAWNTRNH